MTDYAYHDANGRPLMGPCAVPHCDNLSMPGIALCILHNAPPVRTGTTAQVVAAFVRGDSMHTAPVKKIAGHYRVRSDVGRLPDTQLLWSYRDNIALRFPDDRYWVTLRPSSITTAKLIGTLSHALLVAGYAPGPVIAGWLQEWRRAE